MATSFGIFEVLAGSPAVTSSTVTIIDAGSPPATGANRTLTHPDSANFPIVTYACNPERTDNFDKSPLFLPGSDTLRTLSTTLASISPSTISDVLITEQWGVGGGGRASMPASFFRRLYELLINPPAAGTFIQWAPADRTTTVYNVVLTEIRIGSGRGQLKFREVGIDQLVGLDTVPTGVLDQPVALSFLIDSEV